MSRDSTRPTAGTAQIDALSARLAPLKARWNALAPRERLALGAAGAVLGLFLLWTVAVAPAWRTLTTAPFKQAGLERDLGRMQAQAREAQELRALPVVTSEQATTALRAATERLGPGTKLVVTGGQAQVTLGSVPAAALMSWLSEVRSAARARVVDLQLQRQDDTYQGTVQLTLSTPN